MSTPDQRTPSHSHEQEGDRNSLFQRKLKEKEQEFRNRVDLEKAFGEFDKDSFKQLFEKIFFELMTEFSDLGDVAKNELVRLIQELKTDFIPQDGGGAGPANGAVNATTAENEFSLEKELKKKSLDKLISELQTESISKGDEIRFVITKVVEEKVLLMRDDFINLAVEHGEAVEVGEKRLDDFSKLVGEVLALIDFRVLSVYSLNANQLTAKHESLIESLRKDGAMAHNVAFNKNDLVRSDNLDRKKYSPNMGLVQKMVFAAYQEMRKKVGDSPRFSRNQGFLENTSKEFFTNFLPNLDRISIIGEENVSAIEDFTLGIKSELEKFPPEARDVMCLIAKLKTTRDDLGSKAGLWHLGRNKGALKYSDGEKGRPTGLLSAIFYNRGKNLTHEMHAASLAWIDPRKTELAANGRTRDALGSISVNNPVYKKWVTNDPEAKMNMEVVRGMEEINNFMVWRNANWEIVDFQRYSPEHWDEDYPAIDILTNQIDGAMLPEDYEKSKAAVLKIVEMANSVFTSIRLSPDVTQMREKIKVLIKDLSSEVAKTFSFIGQYREGNQFIYTHKMIEAACRFYIIGILNAVPGDRTILGNVGLALLGPDHSYNQLYQVAVDTIVTQIEQNTSLADGYKDKLISFAKNQNIKKPFDPTTRAIYRFNGWRLNNVPELNTLDIFNRQKEIPKTPECPVNVREGWKSSYQDPAVQRT